MIQKNKARIMLGLIAALAITGCADRNLGNLLNRDQAETTETAQEQPTQAPQQSTPQVAQDQRRETIWDLFNANQTANQVQVNKFLWQASLETLNFLPLQAADPFTGVMIFDWGRAPNASQTYRARVQISGPALDASVLNVAVQSRSGAASAQTVRQIEDAILSRARQLRIADSRGSTPTRNLTRRAQLLP